MGSPSTAPGQGIDLKTATVFTLTSSPKAVLGYFRRSKPNDGGESPPFTALSMEMRPGPRRQLHPRQRA